jgi:tripeptidyl-peptidase-1
VKANFSGLSHGVAEEVWNQDLTHGFFESGGGGFSNRFPMPAYQKASVNSFLDKLKKTNPEQLSHFNARGVTLFAVVKNMRLIPFSVPIQISAPTRESTRNVHTFSCLIIPRNNFMTVEEGVFNVDSGTSGAAPTVASIITLVNDARLAAGKSPVGE